MLCVGLGGTLGSFKFSGELDTLYAWARSCTGTGWLEGGSFDLKEPRHFL